MENKKKFKLPHMFFFLLAVLIVISLLTYVVPAGEFDLNPDGTLNGSSFHLLGQQTPVSPWQAMLSIFTGVVNSAQVIALVLINGGAIGVILSTQAINRVLDHAVYRLRDKGVKVVVPAIGGLIFLVSCCGGFGDWLMALTPIGLMVAAKLGLDPLVALGVTNVAILCGLTWSPVDLYMTQPLFGLEVYSGFGIRSIMSVIMLILYMIMITRYAVKVHKDPSKSLMGDTAWLHAQPEHPDYTMNAAPLKWQDMVIFALLFLQYVVVVLLKTTFGYGNNVIIAVVVITSIICGILNRWTADEIGNAFAKGCSDMAFICFLIGLASTMSVVMSDGHIIHTIIYYACKPLNNLSHGFAAVGIACVITVLNFLIPSMTAKAALIIPIVRPMCEALNLTAQVGMQCYQVGDTFTNALTPFMAMSVGACVMAKVPFGKYVKLAAKIMLPLWLMSMVVLFFLANANWVG